jgi:hypothetical protein
LLSQGIQREHFLQKHHHMCSIFVTGQPDVFDRVVEAVRSVKDPAPGDLRTVLRSSTCLSVVFAELALNMDFIEYVSRVKKSLDDLEHNSFEMAEVQNLRAIMQSEAEKLVAAGARGFDKKLTKVHMFDGEVQCLVQTPFDEFTFRLHARIVSIAVNTGVLPMLPWECVFFKAGAIDGVSTATRLPPELLEDHQNVRAAVLKACGPQRLTFHGFEPYLRSGVGVLEHCGPAQSRRHGAGQSLGLLAIRDAANVREGVVGFS